MSLRKKKDYSYSSHTRLSGIFYENSRKTMVEKDYSPLSANKKPSLAKRLYGDIRLRLSARKTDDRRGSSAAAESPAPKFRFHLKKRVRTALSEKLSSKFYIITASVCAFCICISALIFAGVFDGSVKTVSINDSGRTLHLSTRARTVGDLFTSFDIPLNDGDVLNVAKTDPLKNDTEIVIRRALPLTIIHAGEKTEVHMLAGTVEEAISRANIQLDASDEVYPVKDSFISSGMSINIVDVETSVITEEEPIYYKELTKNDSSLEKGKTVLKTKGENGVQKNTIEITYKNGVEYSRKTIKEEVIKEAVNEVKLIGTYVKPAPESKKTSKPSSKPSSSPSSGGKYKTNSEGKCIEVPSTNTLHSGSWSQHKAAPEPDESIIAKTIIMNRITAYTHTGHHCSTGVWPHIGTIACNPKQIPYGTKMYVPGYGYGRIEDTGSNKHAADYYCCDLFLDTKSECYKWGSKKNVKVYILVS